MNVIGKVLLGIGIIVFIVIVISVLNSNPSPETLNSNSSNQNHYNNYDSDSRTIQSDSLDYKETSVEPQCHPSYSGACLNPNASDYDCARGSGNGPYYTGKVSVIGPDVFDLDRDRDGWGCE